VLAELGAGERFWIARELLVMPDELPWLIRWMVNTFVRPSDIKLMKHKHIEVVRGKHVYLRMNLPETKRHSQPIVSLRPAVRVYECLLAYRRERGAGESNDYLFLPHLKNREHALAVLNFFFHWVLEMTRLDKGPLGQSRTLYCLRHTAITLRLLYGQGIDMLTLARNARTSVNMIERFYASVLSGEMNVGLLQSRRGRVS
jgi:integrase